MRRRALVAAFSTAIAGCPRPGEPRQDRPESTRTRQNPTPVDRFRRSLREAGVDVVHLAVVDRSAVLEYRTRATTSKELSSEIGWVAGRFADSIDTGWRVRLLDATILDTDGWLLASFRVQREWAIAYAEGELSPAEFSARVTSTREMLN